ncbi:amidohydrolase [Allosphingosinicella vermicomposti]|uniref:amidohydrolase n=1 Tax=Allosphingosinicella vermicomposti TaxID=614671 RepID=UPI000D102131|nr:amidohydrolase [Allosphingosinicella vermicomposti]
MKMIAALLASAIIAGPVAASPLSDAVKKDMPWLLTLYRDLHANPELSMAEVKTSAKLAAEAKKLGYDVTTGVGKTGVVAVMKNGPGPVLLMRADMDGLPVIEQTGLPFASKVRGTSLAGVESGVMHACGHDTHMTAWIGAARQLAAMKDQWSGTLVMILQPGEEIGVGAKAMLDDGLYARFPKPTHALAFHNTGQMVAGNIGYAPGYVLANVDSVDITVKGVGGHGAYPHAAKDPVVLASRIVGALQTLVSRELDPQDAGVVTVGSFHAGAKHNIIPDEAKLLLTVRSYKDDVRKTLLDGIRRIAKGEAIAAGMPEDRMPDVTIREAEYTPATFNTNGLTESTAALFKARFGEGRVQHLPPTMGGEDFGRYYLADKSIESFIFWVGTVPKDRWEKAERGEIELASIHSPFYAPDAEPTIETATEAMVIGALGVLRKK